MAADLTLWTLVFIGVACALSGFAHGALGFGFPIVATPLAALVIDIKSAIGLLAPVTLVLVLISVVRGGAIADLVRRYWYMPIAMTLGAWLGTRILLVAPPEPFVLVLAGVILLYLNIDRVGRGRSALVQAFPARFGLAFGLVAGTFEAVANVAGPVLLIFFMLLGVAPLQMVQALNWCFAFGKGTQVATWAASGALPRDAWLLIGGLTVPAVIALYAGMRVRDRIDAQTYRRWLRAALWVMAGLLLAQVSTRALASDEQLFNAIAEGKPLVAEGLVVRKRANVNARDENGDTPLHRAVEKGMKELTELLVRNGANLRARAKHGETPLHLAALHSEPDFVDVLLRAGADPRARTDAGESVLMWAALSGHVVVAQRLLSAGADANVRDLKGNLPLHAAAEGGHLEVVRLLLPRTQDRHARNRENLTALDYARSRGHEYVERLLEGSK
ncbi:MAG TPA: TSUP family transporter [Burkholderiales bacterium]|nr:TSUP family transporter [Burkholderiales bacterium]